MKKLVELINVRLDHSTYGTIHLKGEKEQKYKQPHIPKKNNRVKNANLYRRNNPEKGKLN